MIKRTYPTNRFVLATQDESLFSAAWMGLIVAIDLVSGAIAGGRPVSIFLNRSRERRRLAVVST